MDENVKMEGTPLTLEERLECQANEIKTKEQQIEQLKAENDHWQEICADLHIEYGEQVEAQQQEIFQYKSSWELEKDWHEFWVKTAESRQWEIEQLKQQNAHWQETCANLHVEYGEENEQLKAQNDSLVADKDQQAGTIMRYEAMLKEAQQHLTKYRKVYGSIGAEAITEKISALLGGAEDESLHSRKDYRPFHLQGRICSSRGQAKK